jgi:hypothetical protein
LRQMGQEKTAATEKDPRTLLSRVEIANREEPFMSPVVFCVN